MLNKYFLKFNKQNKGYTIIETMIAIALFIIVIMAGMDALLNMNLVHQKSQNMREIIDNLNFTMEDMSRYLRTGYNYHCFTAKEEIRPNDSSLNNPKSCASGWAIAFEYQDGVPANLVDRNPHTDDQWIYYIDNGMIFKSVDGGASFVQMTPEEVDIGAVSSFAVLGAEAPDPDGINGNQQQPLVNLRLVGKIKFKNIETPFSLQTAVSQRLIDI